ncbi:MAG: hypothetical protein ACXWLH_02575 [Candidatus Saccharimonadales bacterium]
MAKSKQTFLNSRRQRQAFWHSRSGSIVELMASLILAYVMASLAINSGSLIEYFLTFALLIIGIYRLTSVFATRKK